MGDHGKACREEVLQYTAGPSKLPSDLQGSLYALRTKEISGMALSADLYTDVVTTAAGDTISITPAEWNDH